MITQLVLERLRQTAMPPFALVDGAADYASLPNAPPEARRPAAYVVPTGSAGGDNALAAGGFRQPLIESFGVIVFTANRRDARGDAAAADLEGLLDHLRNQLVGWRPGEGWQLCTFRRGRLLGLSSGILTWQDDYQATGWLRI